MHWNVCLPTAPVFVQKSMRHCPTVLAQCVFLTQHDCKSIWQHNQSYTHINMPSRCRFVSPTFIKNESCKRVMHSHNSRINDPRILRVCMWWYVFTITGSVLSVGTCYHRDCDLSAIMGNIWPRNNSVKHLNQSTTSTMGHVYICG